MHMLRCTIPENENMKDEQFEYDPENGDPIFTCEYVAFDMYFASLVSMQFHPGAGKHNHVPLDLKHCRDVAIEMLKLRRMLPVYAPMQQEETLNNGGVDNG